MIYRCMRVSLRAVLFLILSGSLIISGKAEVQHSADIPFLETPERTLKLDLYVPKDISSPPLVVFIHGGSWLKGSHKQAPFRWLVDEGFAVASISYRFSTEAIFPAQIQDCKAAIRWLRANAPEYGYNAEKIAVIGVSAGAQLAMLLGATTDVPELEGKLGEHLDQSTQVSAVVSYFGASDFLLRARTQPQRTNLPGSVVYQLLGSAPADNEAQARLASAAYQVTQKSAPLLVFHGTADKTVLPDQSERIVKVYTELGQEVKFISIEGGSHALPSIVSDETNSELLRFLKSHLQ